MRVLARRSLPDWFVTEYFRVHPESRLNSHILRSITENTTSKPIFAQMIGRDVPNLIRTARELSEHEIAGIDLNLGCPAPVVCRKDAGGGLLRQPDHLHRILGALRDTIAGRFTVKTRLGFYTPDEFDALLAIFAEHSLDGLTIHARTVAGRYQSPVAPEYVKKAVETLDCPVIGNGNIVDPTTADAFLKQAGPAGLMIGRGAIRNPWIFDQIRGYLDSNTYQRPSHRDLLKYIHELSSEIAKEASNYDPLLHIQRMKKTLIYICEGISGEFEKGIRRMKSPAEFSGLTHEFLDHPGILDPYPPADSKIFRNFSALLPTKSD